jgi:hypothetical protein
METENNQHPEWLNPLQRDLSDAKGELSALLYSHHDLVQDATMSVCTIFDEFMDSKAPRPHRLDPARHKKIVQVQVRILELELLIAGTRSDPAEGKKLADIAAKLQQFKRIMNILQ